MIIYTTTRTIGRYDLTFIDKMPQPQRDINQAILDEQKGDELLEWGAKILYFDRKECLQVVNFASKFTVFLFEIEEGKLSNIVDAVRACVFDYYKNDELMTKCLKKMVEEHSAFTISLLKHRSTISTITQTEWSFANNGNRFYDFVENGVVNAQKINKLINDEYVFSLRIGSKTENIKSGEKFRELVVARYCDKLFS